MKEIVFISLYGARVLVSTFVYMKLPEIIPPPYVLRSSQMINFEFFSTSAENSTALESSQTESEVTSEALQSKR